MSLTIGTHRPWRSDPGVSTYSDMHPLEQLPDQERSTPSPQHASAIPVTKITGKLAHVQGKMQVHLEGTGSYTFPPPAIGTAEGPVEIHMLVDDDKRRTRHVCVFPGTT